MLEQIFKKHFIIYYKILIWILVFLLVIFLLFYFFPEYKIIYLFTLWFSQILILFIYNQILKQEFSKIFIKDEKVFYFKQNWIKWNISEIDFKDIKELKVIKKWILQNFFDYWNIILDTNIWKTTISNVSDIVISSQNFIKLIKK